MRENKEILHLHSQYIRCYQKIRTKKKKKKRCVASQTLMKSIARKDIFGFFTELVLYKRGIRQAHAKGFSFLLRFSILDTHTNPIYIRKYHFSLKKASPPIFEFLFFLLLFNGLLCIRVLCDT